MQGEKETDGVDLAEINAGDIVGYVLRARDNPVNPEKIWRARVLEVIPETPYSPFYLMVSSVEDGYEGCIERVNAPEIMAREKAR